MLPKQLINRAYYQIKPMLPRRFQIWLRSRIVRRQRRRAAGVWPILASAGIRPRVWPGWPDGKQFAFVLTHDVERDRGQSQCRELVALERAAGFRSSFNFVPERYQVSADLRREIASAGFEIGVHGLKHDGRLFESRAIFEERAPRINRYLDEWGAVGFRAPAMHHNLEWILGLNVEYDLSTFDTDPFEPQPSGVETVFPFWVSGGGGQAGYLEMPYTLPQDFTLFVVMREPNIDIWRQKLDWVVERGGMALVNTHPDYMRMQGKEPETEQYPVEMYLELLDYVTTRYAGQFWHALPREVARHCSPHLRAAANSTRDQVGETELDRVTGPP